MSKLHFLPLLLAAAPAAAQSTTPQVIASAAGFFAGSSGSLSFTIGETAVGTITASNGSLTQGFQPTISASNPLPLDFLSFTAKIAGNETQLEWTTTREVNTDYFEVQRSSDGAAFEPIANVPARQPANSGFDNTYQATDSVPLAGTDYYRLKEIDQNGQATYSPIVTVVFKAGLSCSVYPNPAVDRLFVLITSSSTAQATIVLYDLRGQLIGSRPIRLTPGQNQFELDISARPKGMYIVKVLGLNGVPAFSILKE